jgi:hypothetical protein
VATAARGLRSMIALVYLVWGPLGPEPLRTFLRSYRERPAGAEHELVVLMNGVSDAQRPQLLSELGGVEHRVLTLEEPMQDLAAYLRAAQLLEHERLCFLNSYSEILVPDWLTKLNEALDQPRVGLVGATGSWASTRSWALHAYFLPTAYRGVMPPRRVAREQFLAIELERDGGFAEHEDDRPPKPASASGVLRASRVAIRGLSELPRQMRDFEPFPAHHLRTNAFMIAHSTLAKLRLHHVREKADAYVLESGRNSLTRQVQRMGLRAVVVDRAGETYDQDQWHRSRTFWQGSQEGLLVADNQTRSYERGGADRRRLLSALAWGPCADSHPGSTG